MEKRTVMIRNTEIGSGIPKICIPLVAGNREELKEALEEMAKASCDLVEWRADFYEGVERGEIRREALELIRGYLGQRPLLFTFRTAAEGGNRAIENETYFALNRAAGDSGLVDIVDVEINRNEMEAAGLAEYLHRKGVFALGSNHDFEKTPCKGEMVKRLCRMQELGMDITKIAVMPRKRKDVLELLAAAVEMEETYGDRPCVTMSMGRTGVISRAVGTFSGSAITFGTAGKASAPGQIPADALNRILRILSESIE